MASSSSSKPVSLPDLPKRQPKETTNLRRIDPIEENRRHAYLEWLYRRSGRTDCTYTGLLAERVRELIAIDMNTNLPGPERVHLSEVDLPAPTYRTLRRNGLEYLDQLAPLSDRELLQLKNVGPHVLARIRDALASLPTALPPRP